MIPEPPETRDIADAAAADHMEELLDRALEDTFPASDPFGIAVD
jgi:hypothetical protein